MNSFQHTEQHPSGGMQTSTRQNAVNPSRQLDAARLLTWVRHALRPQLAGNFRIVWPHGLLMLFAVAAIAGCTSDNLISYSLDTPPLALFPASVAGVADGRGRFREIYCGIHEHHGKSPDDNRPCNETLLKLDGEPPPPGRAVPTGPAGAGVHVAVVPGIFGECIMHKVSPFSFALAHLNTHGYRTSVLSVSGRASSEHNAKQIRAGLAKLPRPPGEKLILIGYSKGAADILEAITAFPDVRDRVRAVVSMAGAVSGTPVADGTPKVLVKLLEKIHFSKCPRQKTTGVKSLTRAFRLKWLSRHPLPSTVRYFSVVAFADRDGISTMLQSGYDKLARIDPRNDSQVIFTDAIIPGSTILGYLNGDHWAIALPFARKMPILTANLIDKNEFPREVMLEAVVRFVEESLGG